MVAASFPQGMFLAFMLSSSSSSAIIMRGLLYLFISSLCSLSIRSNCSVTASSLTYYVACYSYTINVGSL